MAEMKQAVALDVAPATEGDCNRADEGFRGTRTFLTNLLNHSTAGVAVFDNRLRCRGMNSVLGRMLGGSANSYAGKPMHRVFPGAHAKLDLGFRLALVTGNSLLNVELQAQVPARSKWRNWRVNFYPIAEEKGKVRLVATMFMEIAKERCLERSLCLTRGPVQREVPTDQSRAGRALSANMPAMAQVSPEEAGRSAGSPSFRERQILGLLADGKSNKEIGVALHLCTRTVETYRARVMAKLDLHSTAALVRYAIRHNIVEA